jgi:serine/threonine protein kinase
VHCKPSLFIPNFLSKMSMLDILLLIKILSMFGMVVYIFKRFWQVCEKLGPSLYDFLRKNNHCPFSVDLVRDFSRQLLKGVACMLLHSSQMQFV